jgi:thiamine-monophosphate kinase
MPHTPSLPDHRQTLAQTGEDGLIEIIRSLLPSFTADDPARPIIAIGDDAAVLAPAPPGARAVLTADAFVEGTHFVQPAQVSPRILAFAPLLVRALNFALIRSRKLLGPSGRFLSPVLPAATDFSDAWAIAIGHRLAMANLSDLASMGAAPAALTLTIAAPGHASARFLARIAQGTAYAGFAAGAPLVGGDTVSTQGPIVLTINAQGWLPDGQAPALRRNAGVGDTVYLTGCVGSGCLAPGLFLGTEDLPNTSDGGKTPGQPPAHLDALRLIVEHFATPARTREGIALGARLALSGRPAMTDVSDGILREAWRMARAAEVHIVIEADAIPIHPAAGRLLAGFPEEERLGRLLSSGEEWELLIAASNLSGSIAEASKVPLTAIGQIVSSHRGGLVTVTNKGIPLSVADRTFQHFS